MKALIVIDVQNEFSERGARPVYQHESYVAGIRARVAEARQKNIPIAWVKHYNQPHESPAFVPGTWGSEFTDGMGPLKNSERESLFEKSVYGAFTGSNIGAWLDALGVDTVVIMGFYTHGCVSTTSREAIMKGLKVLLDPDTTGTRAIEHSLLGGMPADDIKRSTLLQLFNMGAEILNGEL
jgi:nicotinamidase-related amidase